MVPGFNAYDVQVCPYQGSSHICFTQFIGNPTTSATGQGSFGQILDPSYTPVQEVMANKSSFANQALRTDLHEFNVGASGSNTALITSYVTFKQAETLPFCGGAKVNFTTTGLFSEVSTDGLNTPLFVWNAIEHVPVSSTYVCPGEDPTVGGGTAQTDGFDYL